MMVWKRIIVLFLFGKKFPTAGPDPVPFFICVRSEFIKMQKE